MTSHLGKQKKPPVCGPFGVIFDDFCFFFGGVNLATRIWSNREKNRRVVKCKEHFP